MESKFKILHYVICPGDNISNLAVRFNTTVCGILKFNPYICPCMLRPGQIIIIPSLRSEQQRLSKRLEEDISEKTLNIIGTYSPPLKSSRSEDWERWIGSSVIRLELETKAIMYFDTKERNLRKAFDVIGINRNESVIVSYTENIIDYYGNKPIYTALYIKKAKDDSVDPGDRERYI